MTRLSQAQTDLLNAAAGCDAGVEAAPETARAASALIRRGLLKSLPRENQPSRLLITAEGRRTIGLPDDQPATQAKPAKRSKGEAAPGTADAPGPAASAVKGKIGSVVALLRRPEGATVDALMAATGWQAHSVRGAIAGAIKKKLGLTVVAEKSDVGRVYRIVDGAGA